MSLPKELPYKSANVKMLSAQPEAVNSEKQYTERSSINRGGRCELPARQLKTQVETGRKVRYKLFSGQISDRTCSYNARRIINASCIMSRAVERNVARETLRLEIFQSSLCAIGYYTTSLPRPCWTCSSSRLGNKTFHKLVNACCSGQRPKAERHARGLGENKFVIPTFAGRKAPIRCHSALSFELPSARGLRIACLKTLASALRAFSEFNMASSVRIRV